MLKFDNRFTRFDKKNKFSEERKWRSKNRIWRGLVFGWLLMALAFLPLLFLAKSISNSCRDVMLSIQAIFFLCSTFGVAWLSNRMKKHIEIILVNMSDAPLDMLVEILDSSTSAIWMNNRSSYHLHIQAREALMIRLPHLQDDDINRLSIMQRKAFYRLLEEHDYNLVISILKSAHQFGNASTLRIVKYIVSKKYPYTERPEVCAAGQNCVRLLEEKMLQMNSHSTLLRASPSPNASPQDLLRPTTNKSNAHPEQLLRPIEDDNTDKS